MIFEVLSEAARRGELILLEGCLCHWHLRRDGQVTIREILVLPQKRGEGTGRKVVQLLSEVPGATSIFAKCPEELDANGWYEHLGFECEGIETTRSGRGLKLWRLKL